MVEIDKSKVKKILIIKLRGIGDVILSTVAIQNLRKDFPDAMIDFLTEEPSSHFLAPLSSINEIIIFDRKSKLNRWKTLLKVRKRKYDFVIDFFSNPSTAQISYFSKASYRAGFPYRGRTYAYNLFGPGERGKYHAAQLHLEFLKKINLSHNSEKLLFGITEEDILIAKNFISENFDREDLIVGISPTGGWASKKCPPDKFAQIADKIIEKFRCKILLLWGPEDLKEAEKIKSSMINDSVLAPQTSIRELGALISLCDFMIANDSGPMHISTAVGTPVLSLHGPTNPVLQGPFGSKHEWVWLDELDCIGCNLLDCPINHECFINLPVQKVIDKFESLVRKNKAS